MAFGKAEIAEALRTVRAPDGDDNLVDGGCLEWVAACEGYASVRLHVPALDGQGEEAVDGLAKRVAAAVRSASEGAGSPVESLIVEFVDRLGQVQQAVRFGEAPTAAQARAAKGGTGATPPQGSGGAAGGGPASQAGGGGHRPIKGLAGAGARSSGQGSGGDEGGAGGGKPAPSPGSQAASLPGVTHTIAVGAGKGGVGKSAVAVNLAVGLARRGHAVGLMDGDIYGPSLPTMMGLGSLETAVLKGYLQPFLVHGVKAMTIGKLVEPDKPLIWRGPMAHGAFKQLAEQTAWGELDYLIIDLPPGTGDVPLTMAQMLKLTGAVVVCTPQKVAQDDAVRAAKMFGQLGIEVLGVIENMSSFVGDDGKEYDIFGRGGAEHMAQKLGLPFLGAVPITMELRENSDSGNPTGNFETDSPGGVRLRESLEALVQTLEKQVSLAAMRQGQTRPTLTIS